MTNKRAHSKFKGTQQKFNWLKYQGKHHGHLIWYIKHAWWFLMLLFFSVRVASLPQ